METPPATEVEAEVVETTTGGEVEAEPAAVAEALSPIEAEPVVEPPAEELNTPTEAVLDGAEIEEATPVSGEAIDPVDGEATLPADPEPVAEEPVAPVATEEGLIEEAPVAVEGE